MYRTDGTLLAIVKLKVEVFQVKYIEYKLDVLYGTDE
jgi:hypothetical protein